MEKRVLSVLACVAICTLAMSTTSYGQLIDPGSEGMVTSPTGNGVGGWTFFNGAAFETAVSYAASLAILLVRRGLRVGLVAGAVGLRPEVGVVQNGRILRALALVEPSSSLDAASAASLAPGAVVVKVTPGPGRPRIDVGATAAGRRFA